MNGQAFRLSSPKVTTGKQFFTNTSFLEAELDLDGVALMYTVDGSEPSKDSYPYKGRIKIDKDLTIRISAFHNDFLPSPSVAYQFFKMDNQKSIKSIDINAEVSKDYHGKLSETLRDHEKGSSDFSDGKWLGFKGQDVVFDVYLKHPQDAFSVMISTMTNTPSWIFGPRKISLQVLDPKSNDFETVDEYLIPAYGEETIINNQYITLKTKGKKDIDAFRVYLEQVKAIPDWHPGTPENTWIFVDEIIVK